VEVEDPGDTGAPESVGDSVDVDALGCPGWPDDVEVDPPFGERFVSSLDAVVAPTPLESLEVDGASAPAVVGKRATPSECE
jgi:hypothetical protein